MRTNALEPPAAAPVASSVAASAEGNGEDPVVDREQLDALRELKDGTGNLLAVMVDLFLRDAPERLGTMRNAADSGDADTLARAAHNLIGSSGNVGATRMVALCRRIDGAARNGDLTEAPAMLQRLEAEFEEAASALRASVAAETSP